MTTRRLLGACSNTITRAVRMNRTCIFALVLLAACASSSARPAANPFASQSPRFASEYLARHEGEVLSEFFDFLALPNSAEDAGQVERNAEFLVQMLARRGAHAGILRTSGAAPAVYGEIRSPGAQASILFYAHFDGQPAGEAARWETPAFEPTLRRGRFEDLAPIVERGNAESPLGDDARIYARSASDDKGPIMALMVALDALRARGEVLNANIRFFFEGEEEAGSPHLADHLRAHSDKLRSDLWIFADGPIDPSGQPRVVLGVRGLQTFSISVFGAGADLHSGHYGNVAPNPGARLAHLIASMRAEDGAITIRGFDEPAMSSDARALARAAFDDARILEGIEAPATESGMSYGESVLRSALNLIQLDFGGEGAPRNVIEQEASASFDLRLGPGLTVADARSRIEAHVRAQGYTLIDAPPTPEQRRSHNRLARLRWRNAGYPAAASASNHPMVRRAIEVAREAATGTVQVIPMLGGSLPISSVQEVLGVPFVIVPIANADNNQHGPNENIRWGEFRRGVELYAALLGTNWRRETALTN